MQFGVQIEPQFGYSFADVRDIARDAEALGLHGLWVSDHLFLGGDATTTNCLEAWSLLAALTQTTRTLRLGTLVTCQSYRTPALLAKIAAGVDHMSGGRLEFGLGAGWKEIEYRAYGYDFPAPHVRVGQLADTLEICLRMWREERVTYHGRYYRVDDALCAPKPVQQPRPRVWVAGSMPRVMMLVARHADAVNVGGFPTPERYAEAMAELERACRAVSRDPATILRSHFAPIYLAETAARVDQIVDEVAVRAKTTRDAWLAARPNLVIGTPEQVVPRMREYAKLGVTYWHALFPYAYEREMLPLLARRVAPALA